MKIKCFLISMLLVLMVQSAYAEIRLTSDPIWKDTSSMSVGDSFTVDIILKNIDTLVAFQFDIEYNPDVVSVTSATPGNTIIKPFNSSIPVIDNSAGKLTYGATLSPQIRDTFTETLTLFQISLKLKNTTASIFLKPYNTMFSTGTPVPLVLPEDQILSAVISPTKPQYTLTSNAGSGGTISPTGEMTAVLGTTKTFNITPSDCYEVNDVNANGISVLSDSDFVKNADGTASYSLKDIQADYTISASFLKKSYSVSVTSSAGGTILPSGIASVDCGASKIYTITPGSGYRIGDTGSLKNNGDGTYTLENVIASQTINVTFKPDLGNINGDSAVDLKDAVLVLKILSGADVSSESIYLDADVNGDRKIGMEEVIYILNKVADSSSI